MNLTNKIMKSKLITILAVAALMGSCKKNNQCECHYYKNFYYRAPSTDTLAFKSIDEVSYKSVSGTNKLQKCQINNTDATIEYFPTDSTSSVSKKAYWTQELNVCEIK